MKRLRDFRWIIITIVLLSVLGFGAYTFSTRGAAAPGAEPAASTAVAFVGDLSASATASGQVSAQQQVSLSLTSAGRVVDVPVREGDAVAEGDLLVQLDTADLERALAGAEYDLLIAEAQLADLLAGPSSAELQAAESAVRSAQTKLEDLLIGPSTEEIAASQASVDAAQAATWSRSGSLTAAREVSDADIASAQKALDDALEEQRAAHDQWVNLADCRVNDDGSHTCVPKEDNNRMEAATEAVQRANAQVAIKQAQLNELLNPDANQVASAQAGLGSASAQYDAAVARHEALLAGATEAEIAAARAELSSAQASLDRLLSGAAQTEITIAETRVAQAQTALQEARNALADATLTAPFNGIVTAVYITPGEYASGPVVDMFATDDLEIILDVDEVDIGRLAVGQPAVVSLEAWPAVELSSEITAISPTASSNATGAVTYAVHLSLPKTDLPLLVGMTANADLITANRENVLLVPNAAVNIDRQKGVYTVNVQRTGDDGVIETIPVEVSIGLKDNRYTQITSGLTEGDSVLLGELSAPVRTFGGPGRPGQ